VHGDLPIPNHETIGRKATSSNAPVAILEEAEGVVHEGYRRSGADRRAPMGVAFCFFKAAYYHFGIASQKQVLHLTLGIRVLVSLRSSVALYYGLLCEMPCGV